MANISRRVIPAAPGVPALEPVKQDLYDTKTYPNVGVSVLEFFKNPAAGELFSNMAASGQLPHPQQFHCMGIAVEIFPGITQGTELCNEVWLGDKKKVRETAWAKLHIGAKDYVTLPLIRVPEGLGQAGFNFGAFPANGETAQTFSSNGTQDIGHYYDVTIRMAGKIKPIHIPSQQSFFVQIFWPTLIPLVAEGNIDTAYIRCYLVGILWREVQ